MMTWYNGHSAWYPPSLKMPSSQGNTLQTLNFICRWNYGNDFVLFCLSLCLLPVLKLNRGFLGPAASSLQQLESSAAVVPSSSLVCDGLVGVGIKTQSHLTPDRGLWIPPDTGHFCWQVWRDVSEVCPKKSL